MSELAFVVLLFGVTIAALLLIVWLDRKEPRP